MSVVQTEAPNWERAKHREIDICERVKAVGRHTSRALLGFNSFTGADWGGKFVVLSKKTWMNAFLSLDDNDPIVETISRLGEGPISMSTDDVSVCQPVLNPWRHSYARCMSRKAQPGSYPYCAGNFSEQTFLRAKCFLLPLAH